MLVCEDCKRNFNKQESAEYRLTLDSLPNEGKYVCEYHAMLLIKDLAEHRAQFKIRSLLDGQTYHPAYYGVLRGDD